MISPVIYNAILACVSETRIAQAFRRAAGTTDLPRQDTHEEENQEVHARYWRGVMCQRIGELDRE